MSRNTKIRTDGNPVLIGESLLAKTGQASYDWDVASDRLSWSENFLSLAGLANRREFDSGRGFETLLGAESGQSRYGVIFAAAGANPDPGTHPYQCVYSIAGPNTVNGEAVWLEDTGIWHCDERGRPVRAEGVVRVISERRKREETLRRKSDHDDLTGLANRRYIEFQIGRTVHDCLQDASQSAFLIIEIARLDLINDVYGFAAGDEILCRAGEIIQSKLRGDDFVGRFSGAKFGVILRRCSGNEIYQAAQRFMDALRGGIVKSSAGPVSLNPIIGACRMPRHARSSRDAVAGAMEACKQAAHDKQLRIHVHEPDPVRLERRRRDAAMVAQVIEAVEAGSMRLAFQPVVDAVSGAVAFHEALVRMDDREGKTLDAGRFVPVAERLGFISMVDKRAAELVVSTLAEHPQIVLSLNVSNESAENPVWLSDLAQGLMSVPDGAERLIVEITESHAASDLEEARKLVGFLKGMGCRVAIDDFGAGYTSFSNLKELPVDIIKIDGSFAVGLAGNPQNQAFIRSLITLANVFGVKTVVEWVENETDAMMLRDWGVDYLQGNCFGHASLAKPWRAHPKLPANAPQQWKIAG